MKRLLPIAVASASLLIISLALLTLVSAGDTTTFRIDVVGPPTPVLNVQVPDSIYFGNVSVGEQTDDVKIDINNTGNIGIVVTPKLMSGSHSIYNHTYFKRITTEQYFQIGQYSHNISAPSSGGVRSSFMYAKIDLRNYDGTFSQGSVNRINSDVKFFVVAQ
jgi:hypothetical protein